MERGARLRTDYPSPAAQRPALLRNQRAFPLDVRLGPEFCRAYLDAFRQASELNAHVRKGEKGSLVVFANAITRTKREDKTGEDVELEIPYMKGYTVFNVEQIKGLPEIYYAKAAPTLDPVTRIGHAERFFASMAATIKHGGNHAYYAQELDYVAALRSFP
jgi:antirestriction protein ArdC